MPWHYKNNPDTTVDPETMIEDGNSCIPALWCEEKTLIAYSRDGYKNKSWDLPADWQGVEKVALATITPDGTQAAGEVSVVDGKITLSLTKDQAVKISPLV